MDCYLYYLVWGLQVQIKTTMHRTHSNANQVAHGAQGNLAIRLFGSHRQISLDIAKWEGTRERRVRRKPKGWKYIEGKGTD
jgi:hypothetical protein